MKPLDVKNPSILKEIAKRMANGEPAEKFKTILDKILDTEMEDRDSELDNEWEKGKKGE